MKKQFSISVTLILKQFKTLELHTLGPTLRYAKNKIWFGNITFFDKSMCTLGQLIFIVDPL